MRIYCTAFRKWVCCVRCLFMFFALIVFHVSNIGTHPKKIVGCVNFHVIANYAVNKLI